MMPAARARVATGNASGLGTYRDGIDIDTA